MRPSDPGNADRRADCCRKCPGLVQPTSPSLKIYQCRLMVRLRSPKPSMRVRFLPLVPSLVSFWSSCRDWCLYPAVTRTPLAGMSVRITPAPPLLIIAGRSQIKLSTIRMQYKSPVNEGELGAQYLTNFMEHSDKVKKEGKDAFKSGATLAHNPYTQPEQIENWKSWYVGYKKAERSHWRKKSKEQ